jgi:hypothetical protein
MATCGTSVFGTSNNQYIKILGGDFVAVSGSDTLEKLMTNDLRIPYKQILKGKIILKPGQVNYFLNHLGLGDNATFLIIKAIYDSKSVNEEDNYVEWSFYDDLTRVNYMDQLMVLTGNSTHRIPQIYLTNPSTKYAVNLDVMVANIDDSYNYFTDTLNQTGTTFVGLEYTDIHSYVVGESIVVKDKSTPPKALIYLQLVNINSLERSGKILVIDDSSRGSIFLQFLTEFDAEQAHSLLNYVLSNPNINIDTLVPLEDIVAPIVTFFSRVGGSGSSSFISFNGATAGVPYNTSLGITFSTSISLSTFGSASVIDRYLLGNLLINNVVDNRDGTMSLMNSNLIITGTGGTVSSILSTGTYSVSFNLSDVAQNNVNSIINLDITS